MPKRRKKISFASSYTNRKTNKTKPKRKEKKSKKKKACSCPVRLLKINLYLLFMQSFLAGICKKKTTEEKRHPFDNWKESNRGDRNEKFNMS